MPRCGRALITRIYIRIYYFNDVISLKRIRPRAYIPCTKTTLLLTQSKLDHFRCTSFHNHHPPLMIRMRKLYKRPGSTAQLLFAVSFTLILLRRLFELRLELTVETGN